MPTRFDASSTADDVLDGMDLEVMRILVTGASSGIGLETARALASRGATVVGTSREDLPDAERATAVVRDAALRSGGRLELLRLDLGSLKNVRAVANQLLAVGQRFDVVIANAGIMAPPLGRTVDGFELQFAINFLGHLALLNWIAPLIGDGGRVVVLSSQAHRVADIDLDLNFERHEYDPFVAYGRSKTAAALLAVEFDRRHRDRGIRASSVMPGNSLTNLPRYFSQEQLEKLFETVGQARADAGLPPAVLKTIPQAAATSVWAAVAANKDEIGGRYLEDCAIARIDDTANPFVDGVRSYALDAGKAKQLCTRSEALIEDAITQGTEMNVLIVLTSHDQLGDTGRKTGFWLEELAAPYYEFKAAGYAVTLASPKGGQPPLDPKSNDPDFQTDATRRFEADAEANKALANTVMLADVSADDFDTVFYPGGHGPLWDLAESKDSSGLIESFIAANKPVALVCHAPGALRHVRTAEGRPLVEGKTVTGFANSEEAAVGLTEVVPFLVEDELKAKGGLYSSGPDWASYVVQDGLLITGQNPASSTAAARRLIEALAAAASIATSAAGRG